MAAYTYVALDRAGKEHKGVLEADNERQTRQQLRERGLLPIKVAGVRGSSRDNRRSTQIQWRLGSSISGSELALVTRQLATIINASLPVEEALRSVAAQSDKPRISNTLSAVRSRVVEGHGLARGMNDFPREFPELYRATVEAGEQSGHLGPVLERLADYTEARQLMRQKLQVALLYPGILTLMAVAVVAFLLAVVVPEVVKVFDGMGQRLPPLTTGLIEVSEVLKSYGIHILTAILLSVFAFQYGLRSPAFRRRWHEFVLRLPLVAKLVKGMNAARFARTFSILMGSGVPVLEALRISGQVVNSLPMRAAVQSAAVRVKEGAGIGISLEESGYFPPMMVHLIVAGESSGNLADMLDRAATAQESEAEGLISTLLAAFEPLLILVMGLVVLVIVLAVLLPIFDLNQLVQ
ncbi:MAG: type II secretion system inner membrane protein GspF [Gammaproteobacteria bacterium]